MAQTVAQHAAARRAARFHLQARVDGTSEPPAGPVQAAPGRLLELRVQVVSVFRGAERLPVGTKCCFLVPVSAVGWLVPPGLRHEDIEVARRARYVEAYLDGEPPHLQLVNDEFAFIDAPTGQCVLGNLPGEPEARPWWRRWF